MKILSITGSRNPEGKTAYCVKSFLKGVADAGCESSNIFLVEKKIDRCRQCDFNGWGQCRTEGRCIIEDDFASIVEEIRKADGIVFATPVYFGDLSESMKSFLDRLRRITRHQQGKMNIEGKPVIGICVAGGGGGGAFSCSFFLERVLATCGFSVVDIIACRRQNLQLKNQILVMTGQWFVNHVEQDFNNEI